jgi:dimethylhistidine N-methyltransferase
MQNIELHDFHPPTGTLRDEVLSGLTEKQKTLPAKLFYDERGSHLFDEITRAKEYYPARTETGIMESFAKEIAQFAGAQSMLVEFGSGTSTKTRVLLDHLENPSTYVPIDISREHLMQSAKEIAELYPALEVQPICADYEQPISLPLTSRPIGKRCAFFPGSTIGNFHRDDAEAFLRRIASLIGPQGSLIIGVDVKKDVGVLLAAYNDSAGITAAFNLNMLVRLNSDLGTNFDTDNFRHRAIYNEVAGRIEMHLVSTCVQTVSVGDTTVSFDEGETIWTESSNKYTVEDFSAMASRAGFVLKHVWQDDNKLFSIQGYTVASR